MDRIKKALKKLTAKEREQIREILIQLKKNKLGSLDIKKLKGRNDIFRVRKGNIRMVCRIEEGNLVLLLIER